MTAEAAPTTIYYELIAGKDTLVRAQLYRSGSFGPAYRAECVAQRFSPTRGPEEVVPVASLVTARIHSMPYGYFNSGQTFDFWIPGRIVAQPGRYRFSLRVQRTSGSPLETIGVGSRTFYETNDLDLLLVP
jgi:hypothetical protein